MGVLENISPICLVVFCKDIHIVMQNVKTTSYSLPIFKGLRNPNIDELELLNDRAANNFSSHSFKAQCIYVRKGRQLLELELGSF